MAKKKSDISPDAASSHNYRRFDFDIPQIFQKLLWEIEQLKQEVERPSREYSFNRAPIYCAMNCAITAWHITDWIWHRKKSILRSEGLGDIPQVSSLPKLQDYFREKSFELRACYEICIGAKHMVIESFSPSQIIESSHEWQDHAFRAGDAVGKPIVSYTAIPHITVGIRTNPASEVFDKCAKFWEEALLRYGLIDKKDIG